MTLRVTTFQLLVNQPSLTALVPSERWFARGGTIDAPQTPYVVLAWLGTLTTSGRNSPELLDVYVHDNIGDYTRIDDILRAVKPVLSGTTQYVGPGGFRLVQADYLGKSADLTDPDTSTGFRYSSWKILGGGEE